MIKKLSSLTCVALLAGCSLMPWSSEPNEVLTFLPADQLTNWQLTAKFSVRSAEGSESGSLRWINEGENDRLDILAPTGSVVARLTSDANGATLIVDDKSVEASDPEQLLLKAFNIELPVRALKYWTRGLEAPNLVIARIEIDDKSRIREMTQAGWKLEYSGTVTIDSGTHRYEVPRRLTASRGDIEIRWVSTEWQTRPL